MHEQNHERKGRKGEPGWCNMTKGRHPEPHQEPWTLIVLWPCPRYTHKLLNL